MQLQIAVFSTVVNVDACALPANGVCVLWEWELNGGDSELQSIAYMCAPKDSGSDTGFETDVNTEEHETQLTQVTSAATHTVTFIGATRSPDSQRILQKICELSKNGCTIPVNTFREPDNLIGSQATAFHIISGKP